MVREPLTGFFKMWPSADTQYVVGDCPDLDDQEADFKSGTCDRI
jgi:hypothetical protein